jgi:protein arginine kinase activator
MICDICNENEATIEFTAVAGNEKKTLHLCPQCSRQESEKQADATGTKLTPGKVTAAKNVNVVIGHLTGTEAQKSPCTGCGMTYEEFRKIGRLGCPQCYEAFGPSLRRLLKRIHGSDAHVGRGPRSPEAGSQPASRAAAPQGLEELRQALHAAVDAEEYERAAEIRDRIAQLPGQEDE